jgi:aspartate/methionine/tyrosine aminotransferase
MPIELFAMERMQSTWENLVDYDMSESGVRPLTLRELVDMGLDLEAFMDQPLGYSQSNGTLELREQLRAIYPGADVEQIEVTNGTSEANYLIALSQLRPEDEVAIEVPNYMQMPGVARSLGATVRTFSLRQDTGWEPDWDEFERAVTPRTRLLYLGAEIDRERTTSFWGMSDRVIVTNGLSKAYGIPGVRIGWLVGPQPVVADCWAQHDYLTIGPNKLSDRIARVAVKVQNRERCYGRTQSILRHNLPIAREWIDRFAGRLAWREPQAGAIALVKYDADVPSLEIAERVRVNQSTLIVPGSHVGLEGYLRIWLGGREEFLREGLRRIGEELRPLFD